MATPANTRVALGAHVPNLDSIHSGTCDPRAWLAEFEATAGSYSLGERLTAEAMEADHG